MLISQVLPKLKQNSFVYTCCTFSPSSKKCVLTPNRHRYLNGETEVVVLGFTRKSIADSALSRWGTNRENVLAEAEQDYHEYNCTVQQEIYIF